MRGPAGPGGAGGEGGDRHSRLGEEHELLGGDGDELRGADGGGRVDADDRVWQVEEAADGSAFAQGDPVDECD